MIEILMIALFIWLFVKVVGLAFRMAWGAAKLVAILLMIFALPLTIGIFLFAGGILLLIPIALVGLAFLLLSQFA